MLRQQKIVLFLHLLGLDTSGHGYKPRSSEYIRNIKVVDDGVSIIYELIEKYYQYDHRTAYIFTSDHGMTDWGSHGAGDDHETMTPIVAWGAGIFRPSEKVRAQMTDLTNIDLMSERSFDRMDVKQVDIAPLISALLGINTPMNSIGLLPRPYLNVSQRYGSIAACSNFRQLAAQMQTQRKRKYESSFRLFFKDFPALTPSKLNLIMGEVDKLFAQKRFPAAEHLCQQWSPVAVEGLFYYHRYERPFLSLCVALTFALLELCVWRFANQAAASASVDDAIAYSVRIASAFAIASSLLVFLFWLCSFPLARYLYGLVPSFLATVSQPTWSHFCSRVFDRLSVVRNPISEMKNLPSASRFTRLAFGIILAFLAIELLVWVFFYRWILSVGLLLLTTWPVSNPNVGAQLRTAWIINCLLLSIFPLLPTVGRQANPEIIFYTCVIVGICCVIAFVRHSRWKSANSDVERREDAGFNNNDTVVFTIVFLYIMASGCINLTTAVSLELRRGSPYLNRVLSWLILLSSPCLTVFTTNNWSIRLLTLCLSLFSPLTLMSGSYEPLFYICLCGLLYLWLEIEAKFEHGINSQQHRMEFAINRRLLDWDDFRRAYLFVFFIFLSFFGTGNIASINSFDPSFTATFVTVFSPFLMTALLLTKTAIPFFVVCSFLCGLEATTSRSVGVLFWLIVMISDGMALRFFFLLRDHGSWLDIGTSISHFVISSAATLIVMILYHLAKITLTTAPFSNSDNKRHAL